MIRLEPIHTSHKHYAFVEKLMQTAFPLQERRDAIPQREQTDSNPLFFTNLISEGEKPIGFITYWNLGTFYYIEHFAIDNLFRNKGFGKAALGMIKNTLDKPIILEVELPTDETTLRRIRFYEKLGFTLQTDYPYLQPPYREGDDWFPLKLMTTGADFTQDELEQCKKLIHQKVYSLT
ncbi:MAG: GNAT family N-acetyltransferase [Bacteroides sp.]|nr:GNAT family N-acetyltransferase [Bacteroides sp.]